jgi:RsiW-degrading membrane proteinase PrsW (M82 family)
VKLRHLYLIFCALGLVLPYSQFIPWIIEHHALNIPLFIHDLFANRISAFFAADVIVSAVVLLSFIYTEGKRFRVRPLWLAVISVLLVGVSLGLPLFLYLRQLRLDALGDESPFSASRPPLEHGS